MTDQLLQEVDQALRADKFSEFLKQYRNLFIAIAIALVLGTALNSAWQHYREAKGSEMLGRLSENERLLGSGKAAEAAKGFGEIAADASGEFKDLALVWQSRALVVAGDKKGAIDALKAAVNGKSLWNDVACLRLAGLDADAAETCLKAKDKSPLASTRAEWFAANLWAKGNREDAVIEVEKLLANPNTSADSRARLSEWLTSMKASTKGEK